MSVAVNDEELLRECFTKLNYDVIPYYDLKAKDIKQTLKEVAKEDHQNRSSLVCCFSTHGRDNTIAGKDNVFAVDKLYKYFKADNCPQLAGKPKLFFIQACQGKRTDAGTRMDATDSRSSFKICSYSDFLFAFSSAPMTDI
ncbi:caspase-7-like [Centruroides sculpturatus]|uniref:caspase-7-like n=1 Tax=Centruroides sculpturatus TaxID=218467 RepID=UPI000C6D5B23|nr:caspase-7-like [Centruroides sculpturatus]